jgi:hypothetical protein
MIAKFAVPQTRAEVEQIVHLALASAFNDMADVLHQSDYFSVSFFRDEGMGNVPDTVGDFEIHLIAEAENDGSSSFIERRARVYRGLKALRAGAENIESRRAGTTPEGETASETEATPEASEEEDHQVIRQFENPRSINELRRCVFLALQDALHEVVDGILDIPPAGITIQFDRGDMPNVNLVFLTDAEEIAFDEWQEQRAKSA